jgi:hypothetical protein
LNDEGGLRPDRGPEREEHQCQECKLHKDRQGMLSREGGLLDDLEDAS